MEVKLLLPFLCVSYVSSLSLIIPEELSSLLSVAYSNIPPIKKGTDSRVGFGFALGNHADFQVLFELGPQTNTGKIGSSFASNSKRHVSPTPSPNKNRIKLHGSEANQYLQRWANKMNNKDEPFDHRPIPASSNVPITHLPEQRPGEFVHLEEAMVDLQKNEKGEYEIKQPPPANVPVQVLYQLKKLYGQNEANIEEQPIEKEQGPKKTDLRDNYEKLSQFNVRQRTPEQVRKITADLSDVDLD